MATQDMYATAGYPSTSGDARLPDSGTLATNHLNLLYMLAAGLVLPPAGFGGKYYRDTLECFPGWIPLFVGKAPREAILSTTVEAGHLMPVVVDFHLAGLSGPIMAMTDEGVRELDWPGQFTGTERVLLVPAPLPTSWIASITFRSADDRRACVKDAKDLGNVPLADFKPRESKVLFARAPNAQWPPRDGPATRPVPLEWPLAAGGVIAMLLRFANLGEQAVQTCRVAFEPEEAMPGAAGDPVLHGLATWIRGELAQPPAPADGGTDRIALQNASQMRLFWQAVEQLVASRETGGRTNAESVLLEHLAGSANELDPRVQAGVRKLHDTLESLTGLADATANELFARHDTALAHAMTLFFLRSDCADLNDYVSNRLSEPDWLAAAILFGVRDGWANLPLGLRGGREVSDAVSHRMARLSHCLAGTDIVLGDAPPRVRPLRELFGNWASWRAREKKAALTLARECRWDCVHTRIGLRTGEYKLTVKASSTTIEVPGEPRVAPEVDPERFYELLASTRLDHATEAKVRKAFGG